MLSCSPLMKSLLVLATATSNVNIKVAAEVCRKVPGDFAYMPHLAAVGEERLQALELVLPKLTENPKGPKGLVRVGVNFICEALGRKLVPPLIGLCSNEKLEKIRFPISQPPAPREFNWVKVSPLGQTGVACSPKAANRNTVQIKSGFWKRLTPCFVMCMSSLVLACSVWKVVLVGLSYGWIRRKTIPKLREKYC